MISNAKLLEMKRDELDLSAFIPNSRFMDNLHGFLHEKAHLDESLCNLAVHHKIGWMPIQDSRVATASLFSGRAPEPEDVLGYIKLDGSGEIIPKTFEPMPSYRIITRNGGLMNLHPSLLKSFLSS